MFSPLGCNAYFCSNCFGFCLSELNSLSSNSQKDYVKVIESHALKSDAALLLLLLLLLQATYLRAAKVNHIGESEAR